MHMYECKYRIFLACWVPTPSSSIRADALSWRSLSSGGMGFAFFTRLGPGDDRHLFLGGFSIANCLRSSALVSSLTRSGPKEN